MVTTLREALSSRRKVAVRSTINLRLGYELSAFKRASPLESKTKEQVISKKGRPMKISKANAPIKRSLKTKLVDVVV